MPEQRQLHGVVPTIFDPSPFRFFSPSSKVYMCTVIFPRVGSSTTTTTMGRTGKNSYATGCSAASPVVTPVVNDSHGACCCWLPLPSPLSLEPRLPRAAAATLCALLAGRRCPPDEIFTFMGGVSRAAGIRQGRARTSHAGRAEQRAAVAVGHRYRDCRGSGSLPPAVGSIPRRSEGVPRGVPAWLRAGWSRPALCTWHPYWAASPDYPSRLPSSPRATNLRSVPFSKRKI